MNAINAKLRIHLLGTAQVLYGDQPLRIQRRFLRGLLFYLACQSEPVGRSRLMDLLWPEEDEEQSRRHLREALSKLRAQLPQPEIVIAEQDYIRLNPELVYVDFVEFHALVEQVRPYLKRHGDAILPEAIYQQMYKAINLWRQPAFLAGATLPDGIGLERWFTLTSQSLEYNRQLLVETLANHSHNTGDLESAVFWIRRALETDEESPALYQRLLSYLRDLGRYPEALTVCKQIDDLYADLQEDLPADLNDLCERVHAEAGAPAPEGPEPWHNMLTLQLPFVGRKKLLNDLKMALQRGGVEVIWGEAGAGKSRLGIEFYQMVEPPPRLLLTTGRFHTQDMPYQPLIDLMRFSVTSDEWQQLEEPWVSILLPLLPDLPSLRPGTIVPDSFTVGHPAQQLIFEAFYQLAAIIGRRQRLLLFLDDAQWCDADTFNAVAFMLNHKNFMNKGLLVISARLEESNPALKSFLEHAPIAWRVHQNRLSLLDTDEVAELSRYAFGRPVPSTLVERLKVETGGNSLFLLETLRTWLDQGLDPDRAATILHVPLASTIHSVASERLRLLSPAARQALVAAAVIGLEFSSELLGSVLVVDDEQKMAILEELEQKHLIQLVDQPGSGLIYRFIHANIHDVLLVELGPARRQMLNLRTAYALEQQGQLGMVQMAAMAQYFKEGGNFEAAFQYCVKAGCAGAVLNNVDLAQHCFLQAERLLPQIQQRAPHDLVRSMYLTWGRIALEDGRLDEAERLYTVLLNYGEQFYLPALIGSAYNGLSCVAAGRNQDRRALTYLEQAAPFLRQTGNLLERIEAAQRQSVYLTELLRYDEAQGVLESITQLHLESDEVQIQRGLAGLLTQLALIQMLTGQYNKSMASIQQAVEINRTTLNPGGLAKALGLWASIDLLVGASLVGLRRMEEALPLAETTHDSRLLANLYAVQAGLLSSVGRLDESWRTVERAAALGAEHPIEDIQAWTHSLRGDIFFSLRAYPAAVEAHRQSLDASSKHVSAMSSLFRLGSALVMNNQTENGFSFLRRAIDLTGQTNLDMVRLRAELFQAVGWMIAGRSAEALYLAGQAAVELEERGGGLQAAIYYWIAARAAQEEKPLSALSNARQLIALAREAANPWLELRGLELGIALRTPVPEREVWRERARFILERIQEKSTLDAIQPAVRIFAQSLNL